MIQTIYEKYSTTLSKKQQKIYKKIETNLIASLAMAPKDEETQKKLRKVTMDKIDGRKCKHCDRTDALAGHLKACACRDVYYCNPDCQSKDWKNHKKTCTAIKP